MNYYHFTGEKLRDGSPVPSIGEWLEVSGEIEPCVRGLHASAHPLDALHYAPGQRLHLVELDGEIIEHGEPVDKVCARRRKIVASIDATELCRSFSRRVALDVAHLWDCPAIVREYLETGKEELRDAAWAAARAAARDAARDAAWNAARAAARDAARNAEWDAARAAARDAARNAAWAAAWASASTAARDAARDAAWNAAIEKYRGWFKEAVDAEFAKVRL